MVTSELVQESDITRYSLLKDGVHIRITKSHSKRTSVYETRPASNSDIRAFRKAQKLPFN
jgi:hypothetical protein